ncbi:MAG: hypothetical protein AAGB51_06735 [Planctomycetota bacterium]
MIKHAAAMISVSVVSAALAVSGTLVLLERGPGSDAASETAVGLGTGMLMEPSVEASSVESDAHQIDEWAETLEIAALPEPLAGVILDDPSLLGDTEAESNNPPAIGSETQPSRSIDLERLSQEVNGLNRLLERFNAKFRLALEEPEPVLDVDATPTTEITDEPSG